MLAPPRPEIALETIVLRVGRPVLAVFRNEPRLEFRDAESEIRRQRLLDAHDHLVAAISAVGRIEVANHPRFEWIGTGWLIDDDIVVTNRHVANEFGRHNGSGFVFRQGSANRPMTATIDFLEEFDRLDSREFRLRRILHIEGDEGPDMALLQVEPIKGQDSAAPIALASGRARQDQQVAVIGYPAKDSRIPDQQLMQDIFGDARQEAAGAGSDHRERGGSARLLNARGKFRLGGARPGIRQGPRSPLCRALPRGQLRGARESRRRQAPGDRSRRGALLRHFKVFQRQAHRRPGNGPTGIAASCSCAPAAPQPPPPRSATRSRSGSWWKSARRSRMGGGVGTLRQAAHLRRFPWVPTKTTS